MTSLRDLPSVDQFLKNPQVSELILTYGRPLTIEAIRFELAEVRQRFAETNTIPETTELLDNLELQLISWTTPTLRPVCPPKARQIPSGLSFLMISSQYFTFIGSRYTL